MGLGSALKEIQGSALRARSVEWTVVLLTLIKKDRVKTKYESKLTGTKLIRVVVKYSHGDDNFKFNKNNNKSDDNIGNNTLIMTAIVTLQKIMITIWNRNGKNEGIQDSDESN